MSRADGIDHSAEVPLDGPLRRGRQGTLGRQLPEYELGHFRMPGHVVEKRPHDRFHPVQRRPGAGDGFGHPGDQRLDS